MLTMYSIINLARVFFLSIFLSVIYFFNKNRAVYLFLKLSGPSFIKIGQLLASRPDLVGNDLSKLLLSFQDNLAPFSFKKASKIIESQFSKKINQIFAEISICPVACASIAQVYKAKTLAGEIVAVKVLRPNIIRLFKRDIGSLKLLALLIGPASAYIKNRILDIVELLSVCASKELNFIYEASCATEFKQKLLNVPNFYVPKIYWNIVSSKVLTTEWIDGIAFSNHKEILASNFNKQDIAKNLVISYFHQVYINGFFHADMHGGNLFLMNNGDIAVIDFGIMGFIDKKTRIAITEIVMAFIDRDYYRVARLHISAGLIPDNVDINDFALSCLVIGELIVDKPVVEVSMAKLLENLLQMARKYQMKTKPELLLLQKAMMLMEGVGVFLDKDLNIWDLTRPFMKEWAKKNIGFDAKIRDFLLDLCNSLRKKIKL